jgi:hypothetical protein
MRLQVSCYATLLLKARLLMRTATALAMVSIIESKKPFDFPSARRNAKLIV